MKRFGWRWFAVSSMMIVGLAAVAETRPQYGGVLHVAMRTAPTSLDPVDLDRATLDPAKNAEPDSFAQYGLTMLMFDTLVVTDESGRIQPRLATSWQASPGSQRRQFRIRRGVKFHDGTPLSAEIAAASLRVANPSWNVSTDADTVVIEYSKSDSELLAELAMPRNAISKTNPAGAPSGTGPFHVGDWQPGKKLSLAAEENCWRGRPFLDAIEIEMGKSYRDQMTAFELGKSDLVEVAAEQLHRISQEGRQLVSSAPLELLALFFTRDAASPEEKLLREALALSVERGSIRSVLLQGAGLPAGGILPNSMSGYGFVFSTDADLSRARHTREQVRTVPTWTLGYDGSDPVGRVLAERIALNARDAGLLLQPTLGPTADLRLLRIPLAPDPWIALANVASLAGTPLGKEGTPVEELYAAELALLGTKRFVPLFHLPISYAASANLKNWALRSDGGWTLDDAWIGNGKP